MALLGEMIEHLRDRRRRQPRRGSELAGGQRSALEQLDQQLELRVAELGAAEMRVAPAQAVEAAKHATECQAQLCQLFLARVGGLDLGLDGRGVLISRPYTPNGSAVASALAAAGLSRARGSSERSSTTQGTSPIAAIPKDHQ